MEDQTVKNPDKGGVQSVARIFERLFGRFVISFQGAEPHDAFALNLQQTLIGNC